MANTVLKFEVSKEQLLAYFESVCRLVQQQEPFPINLDEVWQLAYTEKGAAVRALKNGFIENVDYKTVDTITKREIGSTRTTEYFINVSCLEFLIARRHRAVFEVYRQVFHKTAEMLSRHGMSRWSAAVRSRSRNKRHRCKDPLSTLQALSADWRRVPRLLRQAIDKLP